jgi:molecular chaperone GrpE
LSSEEQQRREGERLREEPPKEELREQPQEEAGEVSKSAKTVGSEDSGVASEATDGRRAEQVTEEPSEESLEITREEASTLVEKLQRARKERDEYLENMRRMKAELENSRARMEREHARSVELASKRLVKELLPILDNLERALEADGDVKEGVEATREQLVSILTQEGLNPISSEGKNFDPAVHEALMTKPSDEHEEDTVIQTLERGYVLNGKTIRPAKVAVSKRA